MRRYMIQERRSAQAQVMGSLAAPGTIGSEGGHDVGLASWRHGEWQQGDRSDSSSALKTWMGCSDWTADTAGKLDPTVGGPTGFQRWVELWRTVPAASATAIQTRIRVRLAQLRVRRLRQLLEQMEALQQRHTQQSATRIQSAYRAFTGRAVARRLRHDWIAANKLTEEEALMLAEKEALMMCLNAEIERDRLTEDEADLLAQKTALMLCLVRCTTAAPTLCAVRAVPHSPQQFPTAGALKSPAGLAPTHGPTAR